MINDESHEKSGKRDTKHYLKVPLVTADSHHRCQSTGCRGSLCVCTASEADRCTDGRENLERAQL